MPMAAVTAPADAVPLLTSSLPTLTALTSAQLPLTAEEMVWTSLWMELRSKIPRKSLTLPLVAATTFATWSQSVP